MPLDTSIQLAAQMIQSLYHAETQLILALPRVAARARSEELRGLLQNHLEETRGHAERLEQLAAALEIPCNGRRCWGMMGILKEGEELMGFGGDDEEVDRAIISACRAVEHHEIAAYTSLMLLGDVLGDDEARSLLELTLREEQQALDQLTKA